MGYKAFYRIVVILLCMSAIGVAMAAKPYSEKEKIKLADIARQRYNETRMDGASIYRYKGRNVLIVITEVKKSPNSQRVGQVKASRLAGEFLQGATNKSLTVYEVSEGNSYSFQDEGTEKSSTSGNLSGESITQTTGDFTTTETHETFSDKIIQSSITQVGHIEPLCTINATGGYITFAYFMILNK